jgi:pimeloyl-ACP methyl ester carboxylesterase
MKPEHVTSKDGTKIVYDRIGSGPAVILVSGATATRSSGDGLAQLLAPNFTIYNYDRRGRGDSLDTKPYAVAREIEDINALIEESSGNASLYGISSGACLAMEAAAQLGNKVTKLAMYEAPYSEAAGAADEWREYRSNLDKAIAEDRPGDAAVLFLRLVGLPDQMISGMKGSPMWPGLEAVAHTLPYDAAAMGDSRAVPVGHAAKVKARTLVMDGEANLATMPFMHASAEKLAKAIPHAHMRTLEGQTHEVKPEVLAPVLLEFFSTAK